MTSLYWHTCGEGKRDLVLLHGWGLNAEVWQTIIPRLSPHCRLHLVDLPGYGRSQNAGALTLKQMAAQLLPLLPPQAVVMGWSLGGLVATELALTAPDRLAALITVASSPCFTATAEWPGIKPETLQNFQQMLSSDFQRTVERFLALQTLGTETARADARQLKEVVLSQPMPEVAVLDAGLEILREVDLRDALPQITLPFLRLYGALDGLVPRRIAAELDERLPASPSVVIEKAAHAPFISHSETFCQHIVNFINNLPG
ncbi:pimeloyl-[acyl-carrier protein] methyl ester esterase [Pantoea deleyi]|uniref:Pimeloyl-[acyl-carrier protein] methyl ester esterase n=1 Tax=Pantoea deleyi TaxID=470932 RepID=A0A506PRU7_9GAMM|nr:pimeloyl-ACP methyl ester esterase BioH [Pantoea deleyi]ORM80860.1 pimeloyl-[acyl-carrier protein] methyl ester esterase [Pantoea deleyi]TPV36381.1 pimeloyl-ACP methyl ester esterase BioH [Pantoea deleyi]